jgi:hypothetical protein
VLRTVEINLTKITNHNRTKRLTSTLNDIIYYYCRHFENNFVILLF